MTTTEPDVHRADPDVLARMAREGLDAMVDAGAPRWRRAPVVEHLGFHGLRVSVELWSVHDLQLWVALSADPEQPMWTGGMWIGPQHLAVWVGPLAGVPTTVTLLAEDPDARRAQAEVLPSPRVALRPRPRPRVDDPDPTGEHDVAGYTAAAALNAKLTAGGGDQ